MRYELPIQRLHQRHHADAVVDRPTQNPPPAVVSPLQLRDWEILELRIVNAIYQAGDRGLLRAISNTANWLGNGWLYLIVLGVLLIAGSRRAYFVLLSGGIAIGMAHAMYPWIKRRIARLRPFEVLPHLQPSSRVMDRYSCPSGHCMTATAAAVSIGHGYPALIVPALVSCVVIAWARIACAHHYPTDVVAGAALGGLTAWGSLSVLQLWLPL